MSLSRRERFALALLPAAGLLALQLWVVRPTMDARVQAAQRRIDAAGAAPETGPGGSDEMALRFARAKARESAAERAQAELLKRWTSPSSRPETVRVLSELFARNGLRLERSSAEAGEGADAHTGTGAKELARGFGELGAGGYETWRFDLRSASEDPGVAWASLVRTLDDLDDVGRLVVPLSLSVDALEGGRTLALTLWCGI